MDSNRSKSRVSRTAPAASRALPPLLAALLAVGLGAAVASKPATAQQEAVKEAAKSAVGSPALSPDLFYRLMVADIALQRGQPALAARAYYEAAREAKSAVFARRAAEIALASRQTTIAGDAARLWTELDPQADRPKQIIAGIANSGDTGTAIGGEEGSLQAHLQRILAEAVTKGSAGEAFLELNRLLGQEADRNATLKLVQTLAAPYPNLAEAEFAVALAAYNTGLKDVGTTALATKSIDRALVLKPGWDRAAVLKAEILSSRQGADEAVAWLKTFVAANPDARGAAGALAQLYVQERRFPEARELFDRLIGADAGNRELALASAVLSMQMKDWPRAEQQLQKLKADGADEDGTIAMALGEVAEESGNYDLAIQRYGAVPEGERNWLAQLRIATVLGKMKRVDEARRFLADLPAVTIEQRVQVRQTEAQVLRDAGQLQAAYSVLDKGTRDQPDQPDLLYDLAMLAEKLDRIDVAEARLRRVVELRPDNAQALNALGYTLVDRTDRHAEGLKYIEQALALSPDDAFILDSMGWAQYRLGKLDDAERYLRKAIAGRPDAEIAAHLGEVLWVKGERDRAQEIWDTQLKSAPDNPVLLETVRRLAR